MSYWDDLKNISGFVVFGSAKAVADTTKSVISFSRKAENDNIVSTVAGAIAGAAIVGTISIAGSSGALLGLGLIGGMILQKMQKQVPPTVAPVTPVAATAAPITPVAATAAPVTPVIDPGQNVRSARSRRNAKRVRAQAQTP